MRPPVQLREDYDAPDLRALARASHDANQTRHLLALAAIYNGASRREAAKIGGVGVQPVQDWVLAFNVEGSLGLINGKGPGNQPLLNIEQRTALKQIVEAGPNPAVDGGWCAGDWPIWRSGCSRSSASRHFGQQTDTEPDVARHGLSQADRRPRHYAQDPLALETFKKLRPACGGGRAA